MIKKINTKKTVAATAPKELSKEVLVAVTGGLAYYVAVTTPPFLKPIH